MKPKKIAWLTLGIFLAVVMLQNTQVVSVHFLFWKLSMPGIIFLPLILLTGFLCGFFAKTFKKG